MATLRAQKLAKLIAGIADMQSAADVLDRTPGLTSLAAQLREEIRKTCHAPPQLPAMAGNGPGNRRRGPDDAGAYAVGQAVLAEPAIDLARALVASAATMAGIKALQALAVKWRGTLRKLQDGVKPAPKPKAAPAPAPGAPQQQPPSIDLARHLLELAKSAFAYVLAAGVAVAVATKGVAAAAGPLGDALKTPWPWLALGGAFFLSQDKHSHS